MVDEALEQTLAGEAEQSAPEPEQAGTVAELDGSAVADSPDEAVAESEVEPSIDFSRPDAIRNLLEKPEFKGIADLLEEQRLNAENATKQRLEADMRRRMASDEGVQMLAANLARELGVDPSEELVTRAAASIREPLLEESQRSINLTYIHEAKSSFSPDGQAAIDMAVAATGGDVEQLNGIVRQLWDYRANESHDAGRKAFEQELSGMKPEDLRKNSTLLSIFEKWREAEDAAETKAQQREANRIDPGPATAGRSPVNTRRQDELDQILQSTPAGSKQYADAYREKWGFDLVGTR